MDSKIFREAALAYQAVYDEELRQELEEQQDFENWVNSLVEEGYDLSEYTWEEMYEAYITEIGGLPRGLTPEKARAQNAAAAQGFRNIGNAVRTVTNPMGAIVRGMQDATTRYREAGPRDVRGRPLNQRPAQTPARPTPAPAARPSGDSRPAPAARPSGDSRPAPAARPSGGSRPAPAPASRPSGGSSTSTVSAPTAKPSPTPSASAPAKPTPTAPPPKSGPTKIQQDVADLKRMQAASMMRQQGRNLPSGKTPTGDDLKPATKAPVVKKPGSLVSNFDLFDVVKGYLIDEGFAETEQAAIAIMANMSEEWKLEIIDEAVKGADPEMRRAASSERRKGDKRLSPSKGKGYAAHAMQQADYMDKKTKGKHIPGYAFPD